MRFGRSLRSRRLQSSGQSLVEYIMLIALIALVVVGALKILGRSTRDAYSKAADMMEGVNEEADSGE